MKTSKISAGRWAHSWGTGKDIEMLFADTLRARGCEVVKSSPEDDKMKHIDFYVNGKGVDVKAKRGLNKIWLELTNTRGYHGWLKGEAEYIAFHFPDFNHFKFFRREDLLKFVEENVTDTCKTSKPFLKFYTRDQWDQKDVLVKVGYNHIKHLYHFIIKC
jgi:hypothetical protein